MKQLVESLNELERRLTDLLASGLDNSGPDLAELSREAENWREIGFETLASELEKALESEGTDRFTRLFLLERQIDWLKWRLSGPEVPDETWKRPKGGNNPLNCLPLSPVRHGDRRYLLSLVYSREANLVLLEPDGLEPYMLKTALKVNELQYLGEVCLCEGVSFPVYRLDGEPVPEEDISDFLLGELQKQGYRKLVIHEEERLYVQYWDVRYAGWWRSQQPTAHLPEFEENMRILKQLDSVRMYYCMFKTGGRSYQLWPLFVTRLEKSPEESPVLHVNDRIWTEEDIALLRVQPGK